VPQLNASGVFEVEVGPKEISAPWKSSTLLPENPLNGQWGVFWDGKVEPIGLDSLLNLIRMGPGETQWNGKPERYPVVFVATPDQQRVVAAAERDEFQPEILEIHERTFRSIRKNQGWMFYLLLTVCVVMAWLGVGRAAFLPAMYAAGAGSNHLEAWMALRKLRMHPDQYLASLAAKARYEYWQHAGGAKSKLRTYGFVAAWIAISAVQAFLLFRIADNQVRPDITAAALIKPLVITQPWRLLTGPMLHGSLMHILMNSMAMLSLGSILERSVNRNLVAPLWLLGAFSSGASLVGSCSQSPQLGHQVG